MRRLLLYVQAVFYMLVGFNHFWHTNTYLSIMPPWLPDHVALVYISGIAEILLGALLIPVATRRHAAIGLIILLIAIFPANIQMAVNFSNANNPYLWAALLRLPLQLLLLWWAWIYVGTPKRLPGK